MGTLADQQCKAGAPLLDADQCVQRLASLAPGWKLASDGGLIFCEFRFKNYFETIAFVNQVATISHGQDHHPELHVSYNRCRVEYSTHSAGGLTDNDFICAARIDRMQHP